MTTTQFNTVALIATGDELTDGDVQNTTGPAIARLLVAHGLSIKQHLMVPDQEASITAAILSSLAVCDLLIITGGLGPTSDDITRNALAKALNTELVFDPKSWQHIQDRLASVNLSADADNRQQAYFPAGATVVTNVHGTANACYIHHQHKLIVMMPGPPYECLPIFENAVLPLLPTQEKFKLHWLLMGIAEGEIAHNIDQALAPLNCRTGYRAAYPYLEIKVWANNKSDLESAEVFILPLVQEYLVSKENIPASSHLKTLLENKQYSLRIHDEVTGGILQSLLLSPQSAAQIQFVSVEEADVSITGLQEYWEKIPAPAETSLSIECRKTGKTLTRKLFYRSDTVRQFAAEWVCWKLLLKANLFLH
jgi:nicotinamide-nucleotide amidase